MSQMEYSDRQDLEREVKDYGRNVECRYKTLHI
jgi:hypothetical protein